MTVGLIRAAWSGTSGGPGVSTFAFTTDAGGTITATDAANAADNVRAMFASAVSAITNDVQVTVQPEVDTYDVANGNLQSALILTPAPAVVAGTSTVAYASGVGVRIDWQTGVILDGRRLRGHTYMVPASSGFFDSTGGINATNQTTIKGWGNNLIAAMDVDGLDLVVWSRPRNGKPGVTNKITSATSNGKSAILRSRRD